jgi:hypothetical protein
MSGKNPLDIDEKLNLIIKQNKNLEKKVNEQQTIINELKIDNKIIMDNTLKMGKHIDFINHSYDKISKSYLFRNIFNQSIN